ncbi:unnamed protein product, partial [Adineta steineri]
MNRHCIFFGLSLVLITLVNYTTSNTLNFISGFGLTVYSVSQLDKQLYETVVSSDEVRGEQKIRILIPSDYATSDDNRHYPVLYLLHGSPGGSEDWTTQGTVQDICSNISLITVMPNGDSFGWYTNW